MNNSNIAKPLHQDIFYPSDKEELNKLLEQIPNEKIESDFLALLLPHASYTFILPLLKKGLSNLKKDYDNIFIIGPSHQGILEKDKPYNIFTFDKDGIETPYGTLFFNLEIINDFANKDMKTSSYFEEEPEFELLYPLIKKYSPNSKVIPICAEINNSKQSKDFSSILNKIVKSTQKNLIIISGNLNQYEKPTLAFKDAKNFKDLVDNGEYLLQPKAKKHISSCVCGILDSLKKTKLYKDKKWDLLDFEVEGNRSTNIEEIKTRNKIVYHSLGLLK